MRGTKALALCAALAALADPALAGAVVAPLISGQREIPSAGFERPPRAPPAAQPLYCSGEYADDFAALSRAAREFDQRNAPYTYCVRTIAAYECPSYAYDGTLRRTRRKVVAHGTAFGFRQESGGTLLLTNDHVAEWPAVTDGDHVVDGVPAGCRRVAEELRVVDDESDGYERDDITLARVVAEPQLDIAVLRAKALLAIVPWRIGHSAGLRERNVVDVRGFPLGVLRANNVGKVISALDRDEQREWNHDDFVIDALLSPGNSGSPVFAISCRSGEFELVGVYHAGYESGSALNVVIGIDQVRDLMSTLRRAPRARPEPAPLAGGMRPKLLEFAAAGPGAFFPFGAATAAVHARADGALVYAIEGREFPLQATPRLVLEDLPPRSTTSFGAMGRVWAGNRQGLREIERAALDAEALGQLSRVMDALRRNAVAAFTYAAAVREGLGTRERFKEVVRLERRRRRGLRLQQDLAQSALELAERLCPGTADAPGTLAAALLPPAPPGGGTVAAATARTWPAEILRRPELPLLAPAEEPMAGPLR